MNKDHQLELKAFRPKHDFFVGIDSDGCAFNSMEVKHNDGFSVSLINFSNNIFNYFLYILIAILVKLN